MEKTKKVAGGDEPVVRVEIVVEPVVVQVPALAIPVEVPHVAVVIRVHPEICKTPPMPLPLEKNLGAVSNSVSKYDSVLHQVSSFFRKSGATILKGIPVKILRVPENQNSATRSHNHGHISLISDFIIMFLRQINDLLPALRFGYGRGFLFWLNENPTPIVCAFLAETGRLSGASQI